MRSGRRPGQFDIITAQRLSEQHQLGTWRRLSTHGRLVYELDDDCFSVEPVNWQAYSTFSRADVQDAIAHCCEVADLVTVSTEPLAQVMRQYNPNVAVLPNFIPRRVLDLPERPHREFPRIGWMGGASHGLDMQIICSPLRRFLDRPEFAKWDAHVCGVDFRPAIRHPRAGYTPWIPVLTDPDGFYSSIDFDIGLAPLRWSVFNRSKSYIKALEYAARGIPVIATDIEPYSDFVIHGVTGFLAKQDHEWLGYMCELASDEGLRESMGAAAREHARQFTIEGNWQLWEQAYAPLLRGTRHESSDAGPPDRGPVRRPRLAAAR